MTLTGWIVISAIVVCVAVTVGLGIYFRYRDGYNVMINTARSGSWPMASLSFDEFLKFYNLNPDKWRIICIDDIKYNYKKADSTTYRIMFNTYFDYRKYRKWLLNKNSREREEKELISNLAFCDQIKKDIQEMQEESHKQITQSQQRSMDIIQQHFANEKAKKENEGLGCLDPTCWPTWIPDSYPTEG